MSSCAGHSWPRTSYRKPSPYYPEQSPKTFQPPVKRNHRAAKGQDFIDHGHRRFAQTSIILHIICIQTGITNTGNIHTLIYIHWIDWKTQKISLQSTHNTLTDTGSSWKSASSLLKTDLVAVSLTIMFLGLKYSGLVTPLICIDLLWLASPGWKRRNFIITVRECVNQETWHKVYQSTILLIVIINAKNNGHQTSTYPSSTSVRCIKTSRKNVPTNRRKARKLVNKTLKWLNKMYLRQTLRHILHYVSYRAVGHQCCRLWSLCRMPAYATQHAQS